LFKMYGNNYDWYGWMCMSFDVSPLFPRRRLTRRRLCTHFHREKGEKVNSGEALSSKNIPGGHWSLHLVSSSCVLQTRGVL
jgi:hypothetical protein